MGAQAQRKRLAKQRDEREEVNKAVDGQPPWRSGRPPS